MSYNNMDSKIFSRTFVIAVLGLVLSVFVFALTFLSFDGNFLRPFLGIILALSFIVFLVSVLTLRMHKNNDPSKPRFFEYIPIQFVVIALVLIALMFANGLINAQINRGSPSEIDGKYVIADHSRIIRELTYAEYQQANANELRAIAGFPIVFFAIGTMLLYSYKQALEQP